MAVLEAAPGSVCISSESVSKPRDYSHLKPYQFKAGGANPARYDPKAHRPLGSKSFSTILVEAAPKLGKAYLREALKGSAPLLQDTRKVFMPIESDAPASSGAALLVGWLEQRLVASTTLLMVSPVGVAVSQSPDSLTLPPSAGTSLTSI